MVLSMNKKKSFDCIVFKDKLQENAWKKSSAKNLHEYVDYVNKFSAKFKSKKN
jgi:hypothetical protein